MKPRLRRLGLHEVVEALVVGTSRSGELGVEWSLVIDHQQITCRQTEREADLIAEELLRNEIGDVSFLEADVRTIIDVL